MSILPHLAIVPAQPLSQQEDAVSSFLAFLAGLADKGEREGVVTVAGFLDAGGAVMATVVEGGR